MNKAILCGNVGGDPKTGTTNGGKDWARFSLATNERWKDSSGAQQEKVTWHNCVVFGGLAGVVKSYVKKGDKLLVEGRIEHDEYTGDDGVTRKTTNIIVLNMEMLGGKKEHSAAAKGDDNDLPF